MANPSPAPVKLFLNNKLDKDIKKVVQPFNMPLSVLLSSKYKIRDNYITPCEKKYPILLCLFCLVFNVMRISGFSTCPGDTHHAMRHNIMYLFFITMFSVSAIILIICNMGFSRTNISLIMSIQEINRGFDIYSSLRCYFICNWISVLSILTFNLSAILAHKVMMSKKCLDTITDLVVIIAFDLNLVYIIRIMVLLIIYLKEWIKNVINIISVVEENDVYYENMFKIYLNILKSYSLYKTCCRILILWATICSFLRSLFFLEDHLMHLKVIMSSENKPALSILLVFGLLFLLNLKDITIIFVICMKCQNFYESVEEAGEVCIQAVMNTCCPKSMKHLCKRVLQVNRTVSKMTACGLFTVDATLPISVLGLTATYTIVVLQFNFV